MAGSENDDHPPPGVVELREDVPLKPGVAEQHGCAGPRLIASAFATLSAAITLALLTQIYYGDYEVVPHGSVATSVAACSEGGARLLRAGGGALDAAAAAALCVAAAAAPMQPKALDASGSLLYWEYRRAHGAAPTLAQWGAVAGAGDGGGAWAAVPGRAPRLLAALAGLHAQYGALPWPQLLQPAIDYAERGAAEGGADTARLLRALQHNTSAELCAAWRCAGLVRVRAAAAQRAGEWRAYAGGAAAGALHLALSADTASVQQWAQLGGWNNSTDSADNATSGSGLAVVDPRGTYVALVTGVSRGGGAAGGEGAAAGGWQRDEPAAPLDLAPALLAQQHVCGARFVMGAGSTSALLQTAAALVGGATPADAVEAPRGGALRGDAPVNLVRQLADRLVAHADSRAGGLASRF